MIRPLRSILGNPRLWVFVLIEAAIFLISWLLAALIIARWLDYD
jgi:hypothetical protein